MLRRAWARMRQPALAQRLADVPSPIITVPDDRPAANSDFGSLVESGRLGERVRRGRGVEGRVHP